VIEAAGILLFADTTARVLFLERTDGRWDLPGGRREPGDQDDLLTALRETEEETGLSEEAPELTGPYLRVSWCPGLVIGHLRQGCEARYTGFVAVVPKEFRPRLSSEHVAYAWRRIDDPPAPLVRGLGFMLNWAAQLA
jgi:8-oxo-dGTP pyrophosphatase MutT (NUDIX family)